MKNYKLTEDEFITLMSYHLRLKNNAIGDLQYGIENKYHQEFLDYYQKEIDSFNQFADKINAKFNTNF